MAFPLWIELNHITVFNLGMGEITVILLLALIFLGPKKLPELASGLGKIIRDLRKATADVKNEIQLDDAIRKPFEELRDAVTLPPEELKRRDRIKKDIEDARRKAEADMAALAAAKPAGEDQPGETKPDEAHGAVPTATASSPSGGIPVPPSLATGSGPTHVPPPLPPPTGPNGHAVPPPFHPAHAPGSGPIAAAPPGTVPATPRPRPAFRPSTAAPPVAPPAKPVPERSSTTQFLSEADLIPPDRPPPPPVPPPVPGSTGKMPAVPGTTGKTAASPAHHEEAPATASNGAAPHGTTKDEAG